MACVFLVGRGVLGPSAPNLLVASMGASAVLLFCVPRGDLSGPWAVLGGHVISATIGVTALYAIPDSTIAGVAAVGVAIFAMQLSRCLHPPGGATALSAVVGGKAVVTGYAYVFTPVLLNVVVMLTVAYLFHFPKRGYSLPRLSRRQSTES